MRVLANAEGHLEIVNEKAILPSLQRVPATLPFLEGNWVSPAECHEAARRPSMHFTVGLLSFREFSRYTLMHALLSRVGCV